MSSSKLHRMDDWAVIAFVILCGAFLVSVWLSAWLAHLYVLEAEANLKGCEIVIWIQIFNNAGLLGKSIKCGMMGFAVLMPKLHAKRGLVDLDVVARFPLALKLKLLVPFYLSHLIFLLMMFFKPER